jgi:hypothetical protein
MALAIDSAADNGRNLAGFEVANALALKHLHGSEGHAEDDEFRDLVVVANGAYEDGLAERRYGGGETLIRGGEGDGG